jgi:hypothetical protein
VEDGTPAHTRGLLYVAKADPVISVKDEQAERSTKQFFFMALSHNLSRNLPAKIHYLFHICIIMLKNFELFFKNTNRSVLLQR